MTQTPVAIETPFGKNKIELKPWITGAEAEYINEPLMESLGVTPSIEKKGADFNNIDMKKVAVMNHRTIEKFVLSVDGVKEKVLDLILALHEDDTDFVYAKITELRKKK